MMMLLALAYNCTVVGDVVVVVRAECVRVPPCRVTQRALAPLAKRTRDDFIS